MVAAALRHVEAVEVESVGHDGCAGPYIYRVHALDVR